MSPEIHQEHNRGWFYPESVVNLWKREVINAEHMILLGILNALQDSKKGGCWASNAYLARRWKKTRRWLRVALALFEEIGLVKIRYKSNQRIIQITFAGDHISVPEKQGAIRGKENSQRGGKKNAHRLSVLVPNTANGNNHSGRSKPPPSGGPSFFGNGNGVGPSRFVTKACQTLEDHLRQTRRLNKTRFSKKKWYEDMRLLLQDLNGSRETLKEVLVYYTNQPHNDYTPNVESASSFRYKFVKIQDWMKRTERKKANGDEEYHPKIIAEEED